jgi:uncharacterized membrane protein
MDHSLVVLTLVAALGCGVISGVFFAFSTFVMRALSRLPAAQGIAAMQSINVVVLNPWFLTTFIGTTVSCVLLIASTLARWGDFEATFRLVGAGFYLIGAFAVTIVFNVPRNSALAAIDAASGEGAALWARYVPGWTAWNTVRTAASLAAAASLIIALAVG